MYSEVKFLLLHTKLIQQNMWNTASSNRVKCCIKFNMHPKTQIGSVLQTPWHNVSGAHNMGCFKLGSERKQGN